MNQFDPIAYVHADELEELSHCNGMSVWAENALAHTEDSLTKQLLPSGYVPVFAQPLTSEHVDALEVIRALDSLEWAIMRHPPCTFLTDEANIEHAWSVERTLAPYCDEEGTRRWSGPTALEALKAGKAALGMK